MNTLGRARNISDLYAEFMEINVTINAWQRIKPDMLRPACDASIEFDGEIAKKAIAAQIAMLRKAQEEIQAGMSALMQDAGT
jgi:hypothetical protein